VAVLCVVGFLAGVQFVRAPSLIETRFQAVTAGIVAKAAGKNGIVLADEAHADWLLWQQPVLTGRVAYDVRFELFNTSELEQLKLLLAGSHPVWRRCGSQARVVTFDGPADERVAHREEVLARGSKVIASTPNFIAIVQPQLAHNRTCAL
jgi:hypothetical protein